MKNLEDIMDDLLVTYGAFNTPDFMSLPRSIQWDMFDAALATEPGFIELVLDDADLQVIHEIYLQYFNDEVDYEHMLEIKTDMAHGFEWYFNERMDAAKAIWSDYYENE